MKRELLENLFVDDLNVICSSEDELLKTQAKTARAASAPKRSKVESDLARSLPRVSGLEEIFKTLDSPQVLNSRPPEIAQEA